MKLKVTEFQLGPRVEGESEINECTQNWGESEVKRKTSSGPRRLTGDFRQRSAALSLSPKSLLLSISLLPLHSGSSTRMQWRWCASPSSSSGSTREGRKGMVFRHAAHAPRSIKCNCNAQRNSHCVLNARNKAVPSLQSLCLNI